jgi:hypothetical protein
MDGLGAIGSAWKRAIAVGHGGEYALRGRIGSSHCTAGWPEKPGDGTLGCV